MNRATAWVLAGAAVAALLGLGASGLFGQRFTTEHAGGSVGRFVVVRNTDDAIIVMDSATGDLYKASQDDIKPFAQRSQLAQDGRTGGRDNPLIEKDWSAAAKDKDLTPPAKDAPPPPKDKDLPPRNR